MPSNSLCRTSLTCLSLSHDDDDDDPEILSPAVLLGLTPKSVSVVAGGT